MNTLPIGGRHPVKRFDFGVPADAGIHLDLALQCRACSTRRIPQRLGFKVAEGPTRIRRSMPKLRRLAAGISRPLAINRWR
jgi:hypothetical protein